MDDWDVIELLGVVLEKIELVFPFHPLIQLFFIFAATFSGVFLSHKLTSAREQKRRKQEEILELHTTVYEFYDIIILAMTGSFQERKMALISKSSNKIVMLTIKHLENNIGDALGIWQKSRSVENICNQYVKDHFTISAQDSRIKILINDLDDLYKYAASLENSVIEILKKDPKIKPLSWQLMSRFYDKKGQTDVETAVFSTIVS